MALDKNNEKGMDFVRLKDFVETCLSHWHWFVVSVLLITSMGIIYVLRSPSVFTRTMTIQIKDDTEGKSLSTTINSFEDLNIIQTKSNVMDEIVALQSPSIMSEVVKRLNLCMSYTNPGKFSDQTLYGRTLPASVSLLDWDYSESGSFTLQMQDGKILLSDFVKNKVPATPAVEIHTVLSDTVATPLGRVVVNQAAAYTKEECLMHVRISPLLATVRSYSSRLTVELRNEKGSIVDLSFNDICIPRIEDLLNTLVAVYNENWIKDKSQITSATSRFINDRIKVIECELGDVDDNISSFKSKNLLPDVQAVSELYMSQSSEADARLLTLNNQLYMVRYVRN